MRKHTFIFLLFVTLSHISAAATIPKVYVKAPRKIFFSTHGSQKHITQEEIAASGATTLIEVLHHVGGIQTHDTSGNSSQVGLSLRGFGSNASSNTLLLINGIPLNNPDLSTPDLNTIPLNEIEFVEIMAGSESVLYGDQAVGGAINIVTRTQANEKINLSCKLGSYHQQDCAMSFSPSLWYLNFNMTVEDNHTDNYRDNNKTFSHILLGHANYNHDQNHVKLDYQFGSENMRFPGALTHAQVKQNRRQAVNDTDFFKNNNGFFHIQKNNSLNSNWQSITDIAYREMQGNGVLTTIFKQNRNSFFIKPVLKGKLNSFIITTGMDLQADRYALKNIYSNTRDQLEKYSVFGLLDDIYNPNLKLTLGLRAAQQANALTSDSTQHTINRAIASTIGATYLMTPETHFYLRRAESFRFPKADENAFSNNPNGLKTQRGVSYETGVKRIKEKCKYGIDLFALYLKDEINFDPLQTPQQPFGSNSNLDPTTRYGLTFSLQYPLYKDIILDTQYHYLNARFQSGLYKGNRIPLVSENIFRTAIDWRIHPNLNFYTEALYTGNQFSDNDNANIAGKIGGYTIYSFNLRYHYLNFSAALHANNIFNKNYYFYTVYQTSIATPYFYPAPGRNFSLILNYYLS